MKNKPQNEALTILHTESSNGWGGQEMRILKEAKGIRDKGHKVILCVVKGGKLVEKARQEGFLVYELAFSKWNAIYCVFKILTIISHHKVDIINTHSSTDAWLGGIAGKITGRKIIRTRHLSSKISPGLNSKLLYNHLLDFLVTTSSSIIPTICQQSKLNPQACQCIPTGVDPQLLNIDLTGLAKIKRELGFADDDFIIGTTCVLRSWKGITDLLKAAALLKGKINVKWLLVGNDQLNNYQKVAQDLQVADIVKFTGHLENPHAHTAIMDIFVLLSTAHEGISQALLQAAYLQKPLIVTNIGGSPDVCINGENGFIINPFSPEEVANKVSALFYNPALRNSMGQKGKEKVMRSFLIEHTINATNNLYNNLCTRE